MLEHIPLVWMVVRIFMDDVISYVQCWWYGQFFKFVVIVIIVVVLLTIYYLGNSMVWQDEMFDVRFLILVYVLIKSDNS